MKNQYFGDKRDYFKWNLISVLLGTHDSNRSLSYLPMLTPDDSLNEGRFTSYPVGKGDQKIHDYLCDCLRRGYRDIKALRKLFIDLDIHYDHYWDDRYITDTGYEDYFPSIPLTALMDDLVFIDPDVGIVPMSRSSMIRNGIEKYLQWRDLDGISTRIGSNTTLLIYQHLQFNAHKVVSDLDYRCEGLQKIWPEKSVDYIRDKDIAFIAVHNKKTVTDCLKYMSHLYGLHTRSEDTSREIVETVTRDIHQPHNQKSVTGDTLIESVDGLTVRDVVGRRVLCPACGEKIFAKWPLGWDAHAVRCKGTDGDNPSDKKATYKSKYRHLFR